VGLDRPRLPLAAVTFLFQGLTLAGTPDGMEMQPIPRELWKEFSRV
jgi:hypothetical protein